MTAINPVNDFSNSGFIPEIYAKKLAREVKNIHSLSKETVTENGKVTYNFALRLKTPLNGEAPQLMGNPVPSYIGDYIERSND